MCVSHSLFEAITVLGAFALAGWLWWVMFNAD